MPNNFFSVESRFPNIENKTQDEINGELINYLYMLLEQLRYTLGNLGVGNFNESELDDIAGMISSPIYAKIEDTEGNIAKLTVTAEGLTSRVENAEGNISQLTQTAEGLISRISDTEGNISTLVQTSEALSLRIEDNAGNISKLTQTAESLSARIEDNAGNISQLTQTASSLTTRVSNAEGDISTLTQTADKLSTQISNAEGDISTLEQTAKRLSARVGDVEVEISNLGVAVSGAVTVSSLKSETENTVINNATVTTTYGTLSSQLGAGVLTFSVNGFPYGTISANGNRLWLSATAVLRGDASQIYWNATNGIYLQKNNTTYMSIDQYGIDFAAVPTIQKNYVMLNTGNMLNYISQNASQIRGLLGL